MKFILFFMWCVYEINADNEIWNSFNICPKNCKCWEEHFIDLPMARLTRLYSQHDEIQPKHYQPNNDVFYEDEQINNENPLLKVVTCLLPTEQDVSEFLSEIPKNTEILTLLEESDVQNKTIFFHYFHQLDNLIGLEISGLQLTTQDQQVKSKLNCVVDVPLKLLKYLSLHNIIIKNSQNKHKQLLIKTDENLNTLENNPEVILPYNIYKSQQKEAHYPCFTGYDNLNLLKISSCNLQNIYTEMFDGLKNLNHLILEDNNLKFIPEFAFYGAPNLQTLSLAKNNLLNIQITDLAGLLQLEYLNLANNNFSQLSELSFPPFPKLKLADFQNNPITTIFPNTFDVMNTTDSLIVGCQDTTLQLLSNSFLGLNKLIKLTLINVNILLLKRDFSNGMPELTELIINGTINEIEYDAFTELSKLKKLILNKCNISTLSMDSFFGLAILEILDLSKNKLQTLPPGIFDQQTNLKELYLNDNQLSELPDAIFKNLGSAKLIHLYGNPWHCTCAMNDWSPKLVNKIKQRTYIQCDKREDKGIACIHHKAFRYVYENRVAPKCRTPFKFTNIGVFQVLRKKLKCQHNKSNFIKNHLPTFNKNFKVIKKPISLEKQFHNQQDISNNLQPYAVSQIEKALYSFHKQDTILKPSYKLNKLNSKTLQKLKKMKNENKFSSVDL